MMGHQERAECSTDTSPFSLADKTVGVRGEMGAACERTNVNLDTLMSSLLKVIEGVQVI